MKKKVVVTGYMLRCPISGVIWQHLHYIIGFQRLGFEVHYLEDAGKFLYDAETVTASDNAASIVRIAARLAEQYQFSWGLRFSFQDPPQTFGCDPGTFEDTIRTADAVFNICGVQDMPEFLKTNCLVYVESDPGLEQIRLAKGDEETLHYLKAHHFHFTFGEKIGRPDCPVPLSNGIQWRPTRQPVVLDFWKTGTLLESVSGLRFTTISGWRPKGKDVKWQNETYYWTKHFEFLKFSQVPRAVKSNVPITWELAIALMQDPSGRATMEENGWKLVRPHGISVHPEEYRKYIFESDAEWTVAKDQYIRFNAGWFSDRSACYLAAGRPVITQETGFSDILPVGEGLFSFRTMADIQAAVDQILTNPAKHSRAARAIAEEYFNAEKVCQKMTDEIGL